MKRWEVNHAGNVIAVENDVLSERLFVNCELQDEMIGPAGRSRLWGQLPTGEMIKVSVGDGGVKVQCRIFVDNKLVLSE